MLDYEEQPGYSEKVKPLFEADNNDFLLTLFNLNYLVDENVGENVGEKLIFIKYERNIIHIQ